MAKVSKDGQESLAPNDVESRDPRSEFANIQIDHAAEAKLVRKLDMFIIPITMLLYILSFLDRVNIGNARY
jgi:hypothetical protein